MYIMASVKKQSRNNLRIDSFVKLETGVLEVTGSLSLRLASKSDELGNENLLLSSRWWRHLDRFRLVSSG
jgi:hypothetical protein